MRRRSPYQHAQAQHRTGRAVRGDRGPADDPSQAGIGPTLRLAHPKSPSQTTSRVVVFKSAHPDNFISYVDLRRGSQVSVRSGKADERSFDRGCVSSRGCESADYERADRRPGARCRQRVRPGMRHVFVAQESAIFGRSSRRSDKSLVMAPLVPHARHRARALEVMLTARDHHATSPRVTAGSTVRCRLMRSMSSSEHSHIGSLDSPPRGTSPPRSA